MADTYKVYRYTNKVNNKIYIGITKTSLKSRAGSNGHRYRGCPKFLAAIKKYGFQSFESEVLFEGLSKEEAEQKEIELITLFNSTDSKYGYNTSEGGGASMTSENSRKKLSKNKKEYYKTHAVWNKGKKGCQIAWNKGLKMAEACEGYVHPLSGKKHSTESKRLMSEKRKDYFKTHTVWNKGKKSDIVPANATKIMCIETGVVYSSIAEAARENGIKSAAGICMNCKGQRPSAAGKHWKYVEGGING